MRDVILFLFGGLSLVIMALIASLWTKFSDIVSDGCWHRYGNWSEPKKHDMSPAEVQFRTCSKCNKIEHRMI